MTAKSSHDVLILGATSAMAQATARLYAQDGARIVLAGRRLEHLTEIAADLTSRGAQQVEVEIVDLAQPSEAMAQLKLMAARVAGVDDILLFYGTLGDQKRAEADLSQARETLSVNFGSASEWCLAAAAYLEAQGRGCLVVVGSVAGDRGRQSNYIYGASKAGLGVLVQGIAHRLAIGPTKAHAVLVKPGFVDTPMTADLPKGGPLWAKPEAVAQVVRRAVSGSAPIIYAPWFWRWIMLILRIVPAPIFHKRPL